MRVLLIGGTGFIGRHVAAELIRLEHEVAIFHRGRTTAAPPRSRAIVGDRKRLRDFSRDFAAFAPDVVIDLILSSGSQAGEMMDLFRGRTRRVVALSSMDVYRACGVLHRSEDGALETLPLLESSPLRSTAQTYPPTQIAALQQLFGWVDDDYDKIPAERAVLDSPTLPGTVLRLPMVYGPGDPLRRFQPIVKRIADGRRAILVSEGMARWRGTKGFVTNVAKAIARAALSDRAAGRVYNIGEHDTLTELEWMRLIAQQLGWTGEFVVVSEDAMPAHLRSAANFAQHWIADITRLREELGVADSIGREEAVRLTVAWDRDNPPPGPTPHGFDYAAEDAALGIAASRQA
jgi:nucleoside-diphosphate-sugar epimerase